MKITKLALNDILYELVSDITIDNTLTTNQDSVPSTALVKTNIDRIDNNVSEVNTQLSTIQSNLSSLQTSVSELNAKSLKYVLVNINTIDINQKSGYGEVYYIQTGHTASSLGLSKIYAVSLGNWTKINGAIAPYVISESQMIGLMCNGPCTGSAIQIMVIGIE